MPNRIIHAKATESETLECLSDFGERTFWRLTTVADDYGRFDADPVVMLSRCYERRLNSRKDARAMERARDEMAGAGLIILYHHKGRLYGCFVTWKEHQRDRDSKPKYPGPDDPGSDIVAASCGDLPRVAAYARAGVSRAVSREPRAVSREPRAERAAADRGVPASPTFDRFWSAYPKKVGKDEAARAWAKRGCESRGDEIEAALERQREYLLRDEGKYIPNPATWLNQGRWKDEPPVVTALARADTRPCGKAIGGTKATAANADVLARALAREPRP